MGKEPLLIDLRGAGEISLDGEARPIPNKKARAILSMLALAPSNRLSRSFLKSHLWSDRSEEQASASLRQALSLLRKVFKSHLDIIETSQEFVTLSSDKFQTVYPSPMETLLSGLDIRDHGFDDWLRQQRANHDLFEDRDNDSQQMIDSSTAPDLGVIGIGVLNCISDERNKQCMVVGDIASDLIAREMRNFGIAETYDYRHQVFTTDSQSARASGPVDLFLQVSIQSIENFYLIHCRFFDSLDYRQLWVGYCKVKATEGYLDSLEFKMFINEILEATLFLCESPAFLSHSDKRISAKLALAAINETLKGRHGDLTKADTYLDQAYEYNQRSVYLAWKTHIVAYLLGERLTDNPEELRRKLQETMTFAEEQGRFNPVTLALVAHAYSFVFRDYAKAQELFERMFQLNPMQAICYDLSAVTNVYVDNKELAYEQSQLALKLGWSGNYRYCIETTCEMAAVINGKYREAAGYGDSAIGKQPTFTAAIRHNITSKVFSGDMEGAWNAYMALKEIESDFSRDAIQEDDYPVIKESESGNLFDASILKLEKWHRTRSAIFVPRLS